MPADDAAATGCAASWEGLAGQLLPAEGRSTGSQPAAQPSAIHVVVCEPEGVRGAATVLGGSGDGSSGAGVSAAGGTILLRRSAMWLSHTSLVHQVGWQTGPCCLGRKETSRWRAGTASGTEHLHLVVAPDPPARSWATSWGWPTPFLTSGRHASWMATPSLTRRCNTPPTRAASQASRVELVVVVGG